MRKEQVLTKCRQTTAMVDSIRDSIKDVYSKAPLEKAAALVKLERASKLLQDCAQHIKAI